LCQTDSTDLTKKKTWNDVFDEVTNPEEVDLKKTDQISVTVSDRAGQTFEPDMEESGAPKTKIKNKKQNLPIYLPIHKSHGSGLGKLKYF
jgi:spermidine/putrescine-binding protein